MKKRISYFAALVLSLVIVLSVMGLISAESYAADYYIYKVTQMQEGTCEIYHDPDVLYTNITNDTSETVYINYNYYEKKFSLTRSKDNSYLDSYEIAAGESVSPWGLLSLVGSCQLVKNEFLSGSPSPSPSPAPTPGHTHNYEWQIINEPSLEADGLEAEVCTICGARRNEQTVSAFGYALYSYGLNKLNGAKSGDTVILEFGEWNSFPKQFMEKVKEKVDAGVTVVFKFNYQHAPYEITIPAYSTVYTNLEWCGPACMYQLYVLKIPVEN